MKPPTEILSGRTASLADRQRRWRSWAIVAGYTLPAIATLAFILRYAVDIPYMDSFALLETFSAIDKDKLTWQHLWIPHNEHRIFFPRLVASLLAFWTDWNTHVELVLSWVIAALSFAVLCWLSWKTQARSLADARPRSTSRYWPIFTMGVLFFSLAQYENWLWGFQMAWFWIVFCTIAAIALIARRTQPDRLDRNFWLAALLCGLASFSSAHGMLTWFAIAPCVLFAGVRLRSALLPFGAWCALGATAIGLYFYGYESPNDTIDRSYAFTHPLEGLRYFTTLIGGGVVNDSILRATIAGGFALVGFVVCGLWFLRDRAVCPQLAPWLALGSFTIGFSAITAVGRTSLGIESAMASRYVTISVLLAIALVQMGAIANRSWPRRRQGWYRGLCVALVVFSVSNSFDTLPTAYGLQKNRQNGAMCLTLRDYMQARPNHCLAQLFPDSWAVKIYYGKLLDRLDFHEFEDEIAFVETPEEVHGLIETREGTAFFVREGDWVSLEGWATLPDREAVPDWVFLAQDDRHKFFIEARVERRSPDLVAHFDVNGYAFARWKFHFPAELLTKRKTLLRAWAYDADRDRFVRLENVIEVTRPDLPLEPESESDDASDSQPAAETGA